MIRVLDENKTPLMPCSEKRARKLMERKEAKPYWYKGVFCIILQRPPKTTYKQEVVVGIDPGSKFEGLTVKSEAHTLLNIQTEAKVDVKKKIETRTALRRSRRSRKLRYRPHRPHRAVGNRLPPSTKSRWQYKLSLLNWLRRMYPVNHVVVEDISATTKEGKRRWNKTFSPLQVGKNYFRDEVKKMGVEYSEYAGYETYGFRNSYGLKKNSNKSKKDFYTHCVDSWVLANEVVGGHTKVDNERVLFLSPLKRHRRQLHRQNPQKGGTRPPYGGTRSLGLERGTLVKHPKYGLSLVGGTSKGRVSLSSLQTNKRLCQNAKIEHLTTLTNLKWNIQA